MQEELKKLFIQICKALGMQQNDPLMYTYVNDRIDQIQKDFLDIFDEILYDQTYIPPSVDAEQNWLDNVYVQAIHIFSEFLKAITATRPLQKNVSIKHDSERSKVIQKHIKYLVQYANTIKIKEGDLSIDELKKLETQYKDKDYQIRNNPSFKTIINLVFKKNIFVINAEANKQNPNAKISFIASITKEDLDASQLFILSLSDYTVLGYYEKLLDMIKENIKFPKGQVITHDQQQIFSETIDQHLYLSKKIDNIHGIILLMQKLKIKHLGELMLLSHKKDTLFMKFLHETNTRPKLSETDKNNLASEPVLLFNILMKLTLDNVLENLNDGALEKGYKDKYFSSKGLVFPYAKLRTMYASVLSALDYKLHATNKQYIDIQKDQFETAKIYKTILRDLADYTNFLQTAAFEAMSANPKNKNCNLTGYIDALQDISRQFSSVVIADDAKMTKDMAHTIIKFTENVMAIADNIREEINITSRSKLHSFSEQNLGFIGKILNAISRLCEMLMTALCFRKRIEAPKLINSQEGESKRQRVIHKVQKMRF